MTFKSLRERQLLSQERLAELSGLSLRTIQRVEAGYRVSYASLRALAATLEMDVDLLERELYAMKQSTDDFVEVPRWVRLLSDGSWLGIPPMSRRQAHVAEALAIGFGIILLMASFFVAWEFMANVLRVGAAFTLVCGYLHSVSIRVIDTYKLWPTTAISWSEWQPVHTFRSRVAAYAFILVVLTLFCGAAFMLTE
jgi:transcriptional regulator with XRE-family HTH domain